jgi:hypothetical protein
VSKDSLIAVRSSFLLFPFLVGFACAASDARVSETYGRLPLHFEANQGQAHKDVRFLARGAGYGLYLTADEAVLVLTRADAKRGAQPQAKPVALRMSLVGAARKPRVSGLEELPGKSNYFIGKDQSKWRTDVPTYAKVHYREVYPGIDLVYYGNQRQLEYDFVVAPGADPSKIVLGFKGADKLEIDADAGNLVLRVGGSEIRQHKPVIYQEIDGVRREIDGGYVLKPGKRVGFQVAAYDTNRPLIIDPVVLSYSTYLGGSNNDGGGAIAVDAQGNVYLTGGTSSINFPSTTGAFQATFAGGPQGDVFITKLNPTGSALVYSTYLGGGDLDSSVGIAIDGDGNAYVAGWTQSLNFPTTAGAFQTTRLGFSDTFVTKLNPTGSALVYSTYLGGTGNDFASDIAVDAARNAYVIGQTTSQNFPTTTGAFQPVFGGSFDAFITKLDPLGSALVYSTYLGGREHDIGSGIAVDGDGNAYVTGTTMPSGLFSSNDFPMTAGAFQTQLGNTNGCPPCLFEAFVAKLNPAGSALIYSTFLGGDRSDAGSRIAVDPAGNAYVAGTTSSSNFPTTAGAFQTSLNGLRDAFVAKLNANGSGLVYSTYLGGGDDESGVGIAIDRDGNAYVSGQTRSLNFPTTLGAFQPVSGGGSDAFVTKLSPTGSALVYSTYFGGSDSDSGGGIAIDGDGNAYVAGTTRSLNFPTTLGAFQPTSGGDSDAFVAKITDVALPLPSATGSQTTRSEESATNQIGSWTSFGADTGTFSGGTMVASNVHASTATLSFTGTAVSWIGVKCNVCGFAAVVVDGAAPTTVNTAGPGTPGSLSSEVVFSASGLAAGVTHTMVITVTGMTASGGAYIAMDAFDVTGGSATSPILASPLQPPIVPELPLLPPPPAAPSLPTVLGM